MCSSSPDHLSIIPSGTAGSNWGMSPIYYRTTKTGHANNRVKDRHKEMSGTQRWKISLIKQ